MLLGTQWYILFNVIAGAMAIPNDLREAAVVYRMTGWERWKRLILPAVFPYLVTGWVTAAGGAWNASIVAEAVQSGKETLTADGLGATISLATNQGEFAMLAVFLRAGDVYRRNRCESDIVAAVIPDSGRKIFTDEVMYRA